LGAISDAANSASPYPLGARLHRALGLPPDEHHGGSFKWDGVVAEVGGRVVGFSGWRFDERRQVGEVKGNYVLPEFQGRGISTRLVREVDRHLRTFSPRLLKVRTEADNKIALHIYLDKLGYEILVKGAHYARCLPADATPRPTAVELRPAREDDKDVLLPLELERARRWGASEALLLERRYGPVLPDPWETYHGVNLDPALTLVAVRRNEVRGYISHAPGAAGSPGQLYAMAVAEAADAGDTAAVLVRGACRRMADAGATVATTEVLETDEAMTQALTRAGFVRFGAIATCYRLP
jgi:GNAT superfamily N-acetyltransferase